ncbi:thiol-disulfide oxidoreductase DCC family protein [Scopulibacillus cellulosilyticus]|uniref:Thiol-disulfide oxidoreductase DCC family protein n=1 Tax=Scopulibacillus cellulosilyticus TaxID=2665665 RepID=A0ABW2Q1G2_9BACL
MKNIVFYDAECPLCSSVKTVIEKLDWFHRIKWMPVQEIEHSDRFRFLQGRDIYDRIHMISSKGHLHAGIYTIRKLLTQLPLTFPASWILYLPFMDKILDPLYMWISKNRYQWFGRLESYS